MRRHKPQDGSKGMLFAAFGVGLLASLICPVELILVLLAIALVILGCMVAKNC